MVLCSSMVVKCSPKNYCYNWDCTSLLLPRLPKLSSQCYSNGLRNLGNLGNSIEIQSDLLIWLNCSTFSPSLKSLWLYFLFIYLFIYLFIHSFIHSFSHSFIHLSIYLLIYSFIYLSIYSFIHSFIHLSIYLFMYLFIHSFIYPFIYLHIYLFTHSFIHLFIYLTFSHLFIYLFNLFLVILVESYTSTTVAISAQGKCYCARTLYIASSL